MSSNPAVSTVNISLEDHLAESLRPLLVILPEHLAAELKDVLDFTHAAPRIASHDSEASERAMVRTLPYALLAAISKWARTPEAEHAMSEHEPPLRGQDYSMIALLAGTRTSPERKFPVVPSPIAITQGQGSHSREVGDRRAVTAVVNALLSIGGSGVATWWAAGRLLWPEEWKVLLALSVAALVAASEAVLYLIWEGQRNKPHRRRATHLRGAPIASGDVLALEGKKRDIDTPCGVREADGRTTRNIATTTAMSTHKSDTSNHTLRARTVASGSINAISQRALSTIR